MGNATSRGNSVAKGWCCSNKGVGPIPIAAAVFLGWRQQTKTLYLEILLHARDLQVIEIFAEPSSLAHLKAQVQLRRVKFATSSGYKWRNEKSNMAVREITRVVGVCALDARCA